MGDVFDARLDTTLNLGEIARRARTELDGPGGTEARTVENRWLWPRRA